VQFSPASEAVYHVQGHIHVQALLCGYLKITQIMQIAVDTAHVLDLEVRQTAPSLPWPESFPPFSSPRSMAASQAQ
jgi:hypothetical protein